MWLKEVKLNILEGNLPPHFHRPKNRPVSSAAHSPGKCRPMGHLPLIKCWSCPCNVKTFNFFVFNITNKRIKPSFLAFFVLSVYSKPLQKGSSLIPNVYFSDSLGRFRERYCRKTISIPGNLNRLSGLRSLGSADSRLRLRPRAPDRLRLRLLARSHDSG